MPTPIKPQRSFTAGAVPTAAEVAANELVINWTDKVLYTKNSSGTIVSAPLNATSGMNPLVRTILFGS